MWKCQLQRGAERVSGERGQNKLIFYTFFNTSLPSCTVTTSLQYLPSVVAIRYKVWGYSTRIFNLNSACCLILTTFTHLLNAIFKMIIVFCNSAVYSQGTVISPSIDPSMSLQPTSMMAPLAQQMSHLSLGSTGTVRECESSLTPCKTKWAQDTLSRL